MKLPKLTDALIILMIVAWFIDMFGLIRLEFLQIQLGIHYFFEFPLIAIWMYRLRKNPRYTVYATFSVALFWVLTTPLHLKMGFSAYWIVNVALLFLTCILFGIMVGFVQEQELLLNKGE